MVEAFRGDGRVLTFGNGGSAADAQHLAAELAGRFERERPGLPAQALTANTSNVTAIANDYGYEEVFAREYQALGSVITPGIDCPLICLSTSGESVNVIRAAALANEKNKTVIALCPASPLSLMADIHIEPSEHGVAVIQEEHIEQLHYIAGRVEWELFGGDR